MRHHGVRQRNALLSGVGFALTLVTTAALVTSQGTASATSTVVDPAPASTPTTTPAPATTTNPTNPLRGLKWGVYKGKADMSWAPYAASKGTERELLAKISLRPKAQWFGAWISNDTIGTKIDQYIANATGGDPNTLVQLTMFRIKPWEHDTCKRLPTAAEISSYKQWTSRAAAAIGSQRVALILQPDGPFALCAPGQSTIYSRLIAYAAKKYSALPHTSVYIDAGASDWPSKDPKKAADIAVAGGVRYARGFAFNSTHYATTPNEIAAGTLVVAELNRRGITGKHFVINTSSNGQGFTFGTAKGHHPDDADVCTTTLETHCVTLGIPPTTRVASSKWGLSDRNQAKAAKYVDAYLWFGRPWLYMQASPFVKSRALQLARTTPF